MNTVIATGAAHDCDLTYTPGGLAVLKGRVSGTRKIETEEGTKEVYSTVGFTQFGTLAESNANHIEQGTTALLNSGRLNYRTWETPDGQYLNSLDIIANDVRGLTVPPEDIRMGDYGPLLRDCINEATIIGNLVKDAELRYTPSGRAVLGLYLAVNEWDSKNKEERAHFVNVTAWGSLAEESGELRKGAPVYVRGSTRLESWEDKEGNKRYQLRITADDVRGLHRLGPANASATKSTGGKKSAPAKRSTLDIDEEFPPEEDLPF